MEGQLLVLNLVMRSLGYAPDITTVEERKKRQKAIYLAQLFGVDLGYRYSWYLMGPYSTALARDYYTLQEKIELGEQGNGHDLKQSVKDRLNRASELIRYERRPEQLDEGQWIELLASWHYLIHVSKKTREKAREIMRKQKPVLADHLDQAEVALEASGL